MISKGKLYLFIERVPLRTHQILRKELANGKKVLYISKNAPELLRSQLNFEPKKLHIKWLNPRPRNDCIPPMNLALFEYYVDNFIKENKNCIVVLNGIEVLQMWNGFVPVLKILKNVKNKINTNCISMLISIDPKTQFENQLNLLQSISDEVISSYT
ncbi:MAG: DUF835 domain-containing protein [Methanomassiliicoccales archaeon]|jgi:hypothetical protein|nr:DUF835 domain-containing protein [Methanomassiliicoccales archaeon]